MNRKEFLKLIFKMMNQDTKENLAKFCSSVEKQQYLNFPAITAIPDIFLSQTQSLSLEDKLALKEYTGYYFKYINNIMRGFWNYEELGSKTDDQIDSYTKIAHKIISLISSTPSTNLKFKTYRGTNLQSFFGYQINSLEDLVNMEGQFLLEEGFTSTSLVKDNSFFSQKPQTTNIEITYHINDFYSGDGIFLPDNTDVTYNKRETHYIIQANSLSLIKNVKIDFKSQTATMDAYLIPQTLWNPPPPKNKRAREK